MFRSIHSIVFFVPDVVEAAVWYSTLTNCIPTTLKPDFAIISVGNVALCFQPADAGASAGATGQVVYWQVDNLEQALAGFQAKGGQLYSSPVVTDEGQWLCQVKDPFGNLVGLVGPR